GVVTRAALIVIMAITATAACRDHVDGPADDHAARDRAAGAELAAHLGALPGVAAASAIVHTPWQDPLAAPDPGTPGTSAAPIGPTGPTGPTASIAIRVAAGTDAPRLERDARRL